MLKNKFHFFAVLGLGTIGFNGLLYADLHQEILECSKHSNPEVRLACFDYTAKKANELLDNSQVRFETNTTAPRVLEKTPTQVNQHTPVTSATPAEPIKSDKNTIVTAKLIGEFKGWDKRSIFELDNGQIWTVVKSRTIPKKLRKTLINPEVRITKAALGSHNMYVETVNKKIKVKRLK